VELSEAEAKGLKDKWFFAYPEMRAYFRLISKREGSSGTQVVTQLRSLRRRGGVWFTEACNTLFQGLAADGAKDALWAVVKECFVDRKSDLYGSRPVAFIHDEILCEHPAEYAHEAATRLAAVMAEVMATWTPDVPQFVEPCLMDCWSKDAETIRDAAGRLQVWHAPPAPEVVPLPVLGKAQTGRAYDEQLTLL
jgi:DNA polymerase I-like protein with 3'-5' exonuclease and polymerase domains